MHVTHLHNFYNFQLSPLISQNIVNITIDIYVVFDQLEDAKFENEVKTGTRSSYRRHFAQKPHFWVFFLSGTKLKYLSMFQFSTKMTNFRVKVADMCAYKRPQKLLFQSARNSLA